MKKIDIRTLHVVIVLWMLGTSTLVQPAEHGFHLMMAGLWIWSFLILAQVVVNVFGRSRRDSDE